MKLLHASAAFLLIILCACKEFANPFAGDKVLARVGEDVLTQRGIDGLFPQGTSPEDSLKLLDSYVNVWVKSRLKVREAEKILKPSQQDIDRLVEEYKNSLLTLRLDQYYVDMMLDTVFTEAQISAYYNSHQQDFILDRAILKGVVVTLPEKFRMKAKVRELMDSRKESDQRDLEDFCIKNRLQLNKMDNWVEMSELLNYLPAVRGVDYDYLLTENKIHEMTAEEYIYYVWISSARRKGDASPPERETEVIRRVLYNQRRAEVIHNREDSLMNQAVKDKIVSINVKDE